MQWNLWITFFVVFSAVPTWGEKDKCVMYDCGTEAPCVYDGPAKVLEDKTTLQLLEANCPNLVSATGTKVCCSKKQIEELNDQMEMLGSLFGGCPSCAYNAKNIFCQMVCSPDQSDFLLVTKASSKGDPKVKQVSTLNYYITEKFVQDAFDSCKNVTMAGSFKAITLACGSYGDKCTAHNWFDSMGGSPFAPFVTKFKYSTTSTVTDQGKNFKVMDVPAVPCSQPASPELTACSCEDCPPCRD